MGFPERPLLWLGSKPEQPELKWSHFGQNSQKDIYMYVRWNVPGGSHCKGVSQW